MTIIFNLYEGELTPKIFGRLLGTVALRVLGGKIAKFFAKITRNEYIFAVLIFKDQMV